MRQESDIRRQIKKCWAKAQAYMIKGDPILSNKEYAKVVALRWVLGYCDTTDIKWDTEQTLKDEVNFENRGTGNEMRTLYAD